MTAAARTGPPAGVWVLGFVSLLMDISSEMIHSLLPMFLVGTLGAARFIDRVGNGIRGAPRDALLADITPPSIRGAAFGLRQSLHTVGAFVGPLLATAFMLWWANDFRAVFWVAVAPELLSAALLMVGIKEPPRSAAWPTGSSTSPAA